MPVMQAPTDEDTAKDAAGNARSVSRAVTITR
jgi:hypothetical protein